VISLLGVLVAGSVLAVGHAVRLSRRSTLQAVGSLGRYGYEAGAITVPGAAPVQRNDGLERRMAAVARRLTPRDYETRLRLRLLQAGLYTTRPSRFMMIRLTACIALGALGLLRSTAETNFALAIVEVVLAPYLGWMLPDTMLSMRIKKRRARIEREAADLIDLLAITVRAGLGLDQALKVSSERLDGPLADEVRLMLNEIRVGQSRQEALRRLSDRVDTPTVRSFARSIAQSESLGVSIAQTLKALAVEARARHKAAAEETAQKAPIKMVFPLAVCIFPAILIVAAGPGMLAVIHVLGGS
jgi:tight adherence protein C